MKTFLVYYSVTKRRQTRKWSCTVQADTSRGARQAITERGGKVLKVETLS